MPMSDYWDRSDRDTVTRVMSSQQKKKNDLDDNEKHAIAEEIFAVRKHLSDNVYMKIMNIIAKL